MVFSAEEVPSSPTEPLTPSVSFLPQSQWRGSIKSSLHNFYFPVLKTWGTQQVLLCQKVNRKGEIITSTCRSDIIGASDNFPEQIRLDDNHVSINGDAGSDEVNAKRFVELREAAVLTSKIYESEPNHQPELLRTPLLGAPPAPIPISAPSSNSPPNVTRPCKLRTSRVPICKTLCSNASPPPPTLEKSVQTRTIRLRSDSLERLENWPKISITLSSKEIEEDIYAVTGSRFSRRPKKRPRIIQRQLDKLLPGSWLPSISPVTYRVPD